MTEQQIFELNIMLLSLNETRDLISDKNKTNLRWNLAVLSSIATELGEFTRDIANELYKTK